MMCVRVLGAVGDRAIASVAGLLLMLFTRVFVALEKAKGCFDGGTRSATMSIFLLTSSTRP